MSSVEITAKTQKARGIQALLTDPVLKYFTPYIIVRPAASKKALTHFEGFPSFVRPCPKIPRHGFVDSRVVNTLEEFETLRQETLREDVDAELLFMTEIQAVASAIFLPEQGYLILGPSNDGATKGYETKILSLVSTQLSSSLKEKAGITQTPFLEIVYSLEKPYFVQLRDGPTPPLETSLDFIPHKTRIAEIVAPGDDLLAFEKLAVKLKGRRDVVVMQVGASLACHAAIHCVINAIPFVCSRKVVIGEQLLPTRRRKVVKKLVRTELYAGIDFAQTQLRTNVNKNALFWFVTAVLHNWAALRETEHGARLLAAAVTIFLAYGAASCIGELRHSKKKIKPLTRSYYYEEVFANAVKSWRGFSGCSKKFADGTLWSNGYGGATWLVCSMACTTILKAFSVLVNSKATSFSRKKLDKVASTLNNAVNLAHNNGWWLNKIVSDSQLNFVAKHAGLHAANNGAQLFKALTHTDAPVIKVPCVRNFKKLKVATRKLIAAQVRILSPDKLRFQLRFSNSSWEETDFTVSRPLSNLLFTNVEKSFANTNQLYTSCVLSTYGIFLQQILLISYEELSLKLGFSVEV